MSASSTQSVEILDAVIIGAGPAGLATAAVLSAYQLQVRLIDEQTGPGGQIWRNTQPPHRWPSVHYSPASTVIDAGVDGDTEADTTAAQAVSRCDAQPPPLGVSWLQYKDSVRRMRHTRARALIIATGAMERPLLFPGSQLPGVMGVGAVQTVLKQGRLIPRAPGIVLAGHGPLLLLTLQQLTDRGARIDAVLDLSPAGSFRRAAIHLPGAMLADPGLLFQGARLLQTCRRHDVPVYSNITALQALGDGTLEAVTFTSNRQAHTLPAHLLAVHDGVLPNTQLSRLLNLKHRWIPAQQSFVPQCSDDGLSSHRAVWVTGDGAGIAGAELAVQRGHLTGLAVAQTLTHGAGQIDSAEQHHYANRHWLLRHSIRRRLPARSFIDHLYPPRPVDHLAANDTLVCRCEAVTLGHIRQAIAQGAIGPNRVKTFTRCGMGPCQGRQCSNSLTRIVAQETGLAPDAVGALRIRPPLKPILIADYLGMALTSDNSADPSMAAQADT